MLDVREAAAAVPDFDPTELLRTDTHFALGGDGTSDGHDFGMTPDEA